MTRRSDYEGAKTLLDQAIVAQPNVAKFHRNLSIVLERMHKIDEALTSARTAADLAPADPLVLDQLCTLELEKKNTATALACYEKLKAIEPLDDLSQTYYALALFESGKADESLTILERIAQTTAPPMDALNALGVVYYTKKRLKDAVAAFKSAVEMSPEQYELRYNLAVAELARQNRAAAISQYNILKTGDPRLANKLYRMIFSDKLLSVGDLKNAKR
jgi:tetratricopeptide (TPR) repeat protein